MKVLLSKIFKDYIFICSLMHGCLVQPSEVNVKHNTFDSVPINDHAHDLTSCMLLLHHPFSLCNSWL